MNITYFYFDILRRIPGTTNTEYEVNWRIHNVGETTHENDPFIIYAERDASEYFESRGIQNKTYNSEIVPVSPSDIDSSESFWILEFLDNGNARLKINATYAKN